MSYSDESTRVLRSQSKADAEATGALSDAELPDKAASVDAPTDEEAQLLAAVPAAEVKVVEAKAARLEALSANIKALVAEAERLGAGVDAPAARPPAAEAARLGAEVDAPVSPQSVADPVAQGFNLEQLASETELLFDKREPFKLSPVPKDCLRLYP